MTIEENNTELVPNGQEWLEERVDQLTFGDCIRSFRKCEGWSLTDTALKMGISKQLLSDYEHGRRIPTLKNAYEMAKILGMSPNSAIRILINDQLKKNNIPLEVTLKAVS